MAPHLADSRGSVLPLVLVGLTTLAVLALAAYDSARFGRRAAHAQADAAVALHAADSALELYLRGAGPAAGPLEVTAGRGAATLTVVPLVHLADGSSIVSLSAEGRAPVGVGRPVVRRLGLLARLDTAASRERVTGSWGERF